MNLFKNLQETVNKSKEALQQLATGYISLNPQSKQLILRKHTVSLLCQQVEKKVSQITSLKPHPTEGLLAVIQRDNMTITLHFTPVSVTFKEDVIEGKIKLLQKLDIKTDSWFYNTLLQGWKVFLGGVIPNVSLEKIKIEGQDVLYSFPRNEIKLLEILFEGINAGSSLNLSLKQEELAIGGDLSISWDKINIKELITLLHSFK